MSKLRGYTERIYTQDEVNDILSTIQDFVNELGWDYQRMSQSGQKVYNQLDEYIENL